METQPFTPEENQLLQAGIARCLAQTHLSTSGGVLHWLCGQPDVAAVAEKFLALRRQRGYQD